MDFAFVSGVAICGVCARTHIVPTLKAAQTLRHHAFAQHVTAHQGLAFYTPHVNGPPSVAEMSELLHVGHVFAAMPVTPHGEHIRLDDYLPIETADLPRLAVRDAENNRDDLSSKEKKTRPDHLDEVEKQLAETSPSIAYTHRPGPSRTVSPST